MNKFLKLRLLGREQNLTVMRIEVNRNLSRSQVRRVIDVQLEVW